DNYPNRLSTRDYENIGKPVLGAKRTYTVDLNVEEGDYIGIGSDTTVNVFKKAGNGVWQDTPNYVPCTNHTFMVFSPDLTICLYGTGTTIVGWPHKWNTLTIGKWNTKEIIKWNDLE
ncbi:unnamed protein product, partial [marine sediment metagenome]